MNKPPIHPPKYWLRFFRWFCHPDFLEDIEGDLIERFERRGNTTASRKANWLFAKDVLSLFRPGIIRPLRNPYSRISFDMYKHYLTIAWRNLKKNRSFSLINIGGLAVSLMCCLFLLLYIFSETSYDKHHINHQQLFLVNSTAINLDGESQEYPKLSAPYAGALATAFPEIETTTRLWVNFIDNKTPLQIENSSGIPKVFYEPKALHVDPSFFDLFAYQFVEKQNGAGLLDEPNSVVISERLAKKLFGDTPALQQQIKIGGTTGFDQVFKVTGVFQEESHRSHIDAHLFVPINAGWIGSFVKNEPQNFSSNNILYTYVKLKENTSAEQVNQKLSAFMDEYAGKDLKDAGFDKNLSLLPVADIHLYDNIETIVSPTNSASYLYILACIGLLTLLIACINFMNLSTAQAARRAKEVGLRKTFGARKSMLVKQFLSESIFFTFCALLIGMGLVYLLLPAFNSLTGKTLSILNLWSLNLVGGILLLVLCTGVIAGSYPAFYLALFKPFQAISNKGSQLSSLINLRRVTVIFQFIIAVGLIVSTLVIQKQMQFLENKPLGFQVDQQIVIPLQSTQSWRNYSALRNELKKNPIVNEAAGTQFYPGIENPSSVSLYRPDQTVNDIQSVRTNWVAPEFLDQMGFELLAGRLFSPSFPVDTANRIVVNEATLKACSVALSNAIGQKLNFAWQGQTINYEIVGVIKDFHFEDLHQTIKPYAFFLNKDTRYNYMMVHIKTDDMGKALQALQSSWEKTNPAEPFQYSFLQADFQQNYNADQQTAKIVSFFTFIAIVIACLGLFSLVAFAAERRTKEIGIRKVLGASVGSITYLLSKELVALVFISILIAIPVAWWMMNEWLQGFAYRTQLEWWLFGLASIASLLIALFTVSFHAIKAGLSNPITALRSE